MQAYLGLARQSTNRQTHKAAVDIATDSAVHARELSEVMGREGEPWHVGGAGGLLRSIVYGFNDGLTANFGLVAGVIGASVDAARRDHHRRRRRDRRRACRWGRAGISRRRARRRCRRTRSRWSAHEMRLMPDLEEDELALIYEAKGLPPRARAGDRAGDDAGSGARARNAGARGAQHPSRRARAAQGRPGDRHRHRGRRLHSDRAVPGAGAPARRSGCRSRSACSPTSAIGAARSLFTGRGIWVSGRDMFVVGFGVAAVGYLIGELLPRFL